MTIHTHALALVSINQFAKRSDKMSNSMKSMRVAKGMSRSFCFVLLLFTFGVLSAQNQEHRVRNIVLVHGAWADGSGWKGVTTFLSRMATTSALSKNRRHPLKMTWLPRSASLLYKTDRAFLSVIAMGEP